MYNPTYSLTSTLDEVWSASRSGRFTSQGKSPWYPLDMRLGGPQSRSERGGEERYLAAAGTRTPDHTARSPALYFLISCHILLLYLNSLMVLVTRVAKLELIDFKLFIP
jgi:hypothetical protein